MSNIDNPNEAAAVNELVITRIFVAPRELVWRAWTEPNYATKWWGPKDFTAPVCKIDLRVGGKYLFCMRAPEGKDYWSTGVYREIVEHERLVCTDSFADEHGNVVPATHYGMVGDFPLEFEVTVILDDIKGKTMMTLNHKGMPAGEMGDMASQGWNQSFDKLAESLK
ncbi:MAG: ATPase [Ignavibacteria bacterium GWB2_35_12]|nr:MAG: ATPase [Ignavibacteria bacterium GWB2_35_12]OGU95767.1 MAG: ATPase [Ignavibacteria bacterium RIFOXYA2_FULL_35_10]OGV21356.1 MAG: ATPase [Ignavibacteria bacterium RIFOXYC2_FULL_35_21]